MLPALVNDAKQLGKGLVLLSNEDITALDTVYDEVVVVLSKKVTKSIFEKLMKLNWLCCDEEEGESWIFALN